MIDNNHIHRFLTGVLLFCVCVKMIQMFKIKICSIVLTILSF